MKSFYKLALLLLTLCQGVCAQPELPPAIFVRQDATGQGTSWDDARGTVPTGILPEGTRVYIATGNYSVDQSIDLSIGNILIQGGFPATLSGTDIRSYSPAKYPTHLSMMTGSPFYLAMYTKSYDSTKVSTVQGIEHTGMVENQNFALGALFRSESAFGTFNFTDVSIHDISLVGGAVNLMYTGVRVNLLRCNMYNIQAWDGSAALQVVNIQESLPEEKAKLLVTDGIFSNNLGYNGSAISLAGIQEAVFRNTLFCGNTSYREGGALSLTGSKISLDGCTFTNNRAFQQGGAINAVASQITSAGCQLHYNSANIFGGAICFEKSYEDGFSTISDAVFFKNRSGRGGAVYASGVSGLTFTGSRFVSNFGTWQMPGAAIYNDFSKISIISSLFAGNSGSDGATGPGADMHIEGLSGSFRVSSSKMQLPGSGNYPVAETVESSGFVFQGTENTFGNTDRGGVSGPDVASCAVPVVPVSGMVFNDGNGASDNLFSGPTENLPALRVSLLDGADTLATVPVEKGAFAFENVLPGRYQLKLILPDSASPDYNKWTYSGETIRSWEVYYDQQIDGVLNVALDGGAYDQIVFIVNQRPMADTVRHLMAAPAPGQTVTLDGLEGNLPLFSGKDADPDMLPYMLRFRITRLPDHGELLVFGAVPSPENIYSMAPGAVTLQFTGAGYDSLSFDYVLVDVIGAESAPATYTIRFDKPLPVTLRSFSARAEGRQANLIWETVSEHQAATFVVQRSLDGKNWSELGMVKAAGESRVTQSYQFTDANPNLEDDNLYRLKMVDVDGTFTFSRIANVSFDAAASLSMYPNPTSDVVYIEVADWAKVKSVSMTNAAGKVLYHGGATRKLDLAGYPAGMYLIQLENVDGTSRYKKIIVSK